MTSTFLFPSFRIPVDKEVNEHVSQSSASSSSSSSTNWKQEGSLLWERCCITVPSIVEIANMDVTAGLERLQSARMQLYKVLLFASGQEEAAPDKNSSRNNNSMNPKQAEQQAAQLDNIRSTLVNYAVLLQSCRQELEHVLQQVPLTAGAAESESLDSQAAANTAALLEGSIADLLLLNWKDVGASTIIDNKNDSSSSTLWVRPPVPRMHEPVQSSNFGPQRVSQLWMWILQWEESHVYWNLSVVEMKRALALVQFSEPSRPGWKQAGTHWQTAAAFMQFLRTQMGFFVGDSLRAKNPKLVVTPSPEDWYLPWETWMMAQAQRAAYQFVFMAPRPSPLMMAKIAAGAVPLYAQAASAFTAHIANSEVCKAWYLALSAVSEYHQACVHAAKQEALPWAQAMARIDRAVQLGRSAQEFFHSLLSEYGNGFEIETNMVIAPSFLLELQELIQTTWPAMRELQQTLMSSDNVAAISTEQLESLELPEIPPQNLVKIQPMQTIDTALKDSSIQGMGPLFPGLGEEARRYRLAFYHDLQHLWQQTVQSSETKTEQARQSLAQVDLPHVLTRYQEEYGNDQVANERLSEISSSPTPNLSSGSALRASSLWQRVQHIQQGTNYGNTQPGKKGKHVGLSELQQGLWQLRDSSEQAHLLLNEIKRQLEENVSLDHEFSRANPSYEAKHDVEDIQASFWHSLQKYEQLLHSAASGDKVLFGRLEVLPTDPKFQLLSRLTQSQVERLVNSASQSSAGQQEDQQRSQTSSELQESAERLNRDLLALSALFQAREELIHDRLPHKIQASLRDATRRLRKIKGGEAEMESVIQKTQSVVQTVLEAIRVNLQEQTPLMNVILQENNIFQALLAQKQEQTSNSGFAAVASAPNAMERSTSTDSMGAAERTLVMLEEALEEMEQFTGHWQQGEVFYQGVIPKLTKLQQQVSEVSTRLAIDRCEFDDQLAKNTQEAKDAAMAASLADAADSTRSDNPAAVAASNSAGDTEDDPTKESTAEQLSAEALLASLPQDGELRRDGVVGEEKDEGGPTSQHQGSMFVHQVRNDETPSVEVDDGKLANLIAMDFDPDKVVAALQKYDNDLDQALNELLSA